MRPRAWCPTPFAEFSPEWQALQAARRIQAQTYFIDLPCWAQSEEEDDSPDTQDESQTLLLRATCMDNSDTCGITYSKMKAKLHYPLRAHYFPTAGQFPVDVLNRQREAFMARWITWAMQQNNGDVLVVCGGWHAPALAKCGANARRKLTSQNCPRWQMPLLVVISQPAAKRPDAGRIPFRNAHRSGKTGSVAYSRQVNSQNGSTRLRQHKLPASTADMAAAHLHAMALAQLRGHTLPLRTDWLDAIAGSLD